MTVTSQPTSTDYARHAAPARAAQPLDAQRYAWRVWAAVSATVVVLYVLLLNPYWVPGGDSELYLAVARNWATGRGHTFNGQSVSICPPGWPLLLAGAMKISPTFAFFKVITLLCLAGAMSMWYWILLRFTAPILAGTIVLITAIIQHVYSLTFWMHSDALFCLLASGAMLLACQINEGRSHIYLRIVWLMALCIGMTFVRWAGALQWLIVAGLLLRGIPLPLNRAWAKQFSAGVATAPWIALLVTCIATVGTFVTVRQILKLTPQQELAAKDAGAVFDESQAPLTAEAKTVDIFTAKATAKKSVLRQYCERMVNSGKWFSWMLWPVTRFFASGGRWINWIDTALGWPLLLLLAAAVAGGVRRRQWIWPAIGISCVVLCLGWPNPNARYLVPIAPLVVFGIIRGIETIGRGAKWSPLHRRAIVAFLASIALCNASLYAIDVMVARTHNFYARYEGGLDQSLIDATAYLNTLQLGGRRVAVSEEYINLGRRRASKFGLRASVMLTDLEIVNTPIDSADEPISPRFVKWARQHRVVQWYLFQEEISPWRVWHFRIPGALQTWLTKEPVPPPNQGWVLYHRNGAQWEKVPVPRQSSGPTRVPGM
jgi:hypothetical protein